MTTRSGKLPNVLFTMGDDIGWYNVSAYDLGVMGYRTPDIAEQHTGIHPKYPLGVWQDKFTELRAPGLCNLRSDPFGNATR